MPLRIPQDYQGTTWFDPKRDPTLDECESYLEWLRAEVRLVKTYMRTRENSDLATKPAGKTARPQASS